MMIVQLHDPPIRFGLLKVYFIGYSADLQVLYVLKMLVHADADGVALRHGTPFLPPVD